MPRVRVEFPSAGAISCKQGGDHGRQFGGDLSQTGGVSEIDVHAMYVKKYLGTQEVILERYEAVVKNKKENDVAETTPSVNEYARKLPGGHRRKAGGQISRHRFTPISVDGNKQTGTVKADRFPASFQTR